MNWNGKKVLVAGGAGMIGSHMARRLLKLGAVVTVADNLSSGSIKNIRDILGDIVFLEDDLRDMELCLKATKGQDIVMQFAADMGGVTYINTVHAAIVRNSGLINLNMLEAARLNGGGHYFWSSSACVYPEHLQTDADVVPLKESDAYPAFPDMSYGWEKIFTEQACFAFKKDYGLNVRIARFHNIFGEAFTAFDKLKSKAPCMMISRALQYPKANIEIWADGRQSRSFCYIDDCIDGVLKLMESSYSEPINIGSDRLITMNDLAKLVIKISGKDMQPVYFSDKPQGVRGRNASLDLVKQVLGWEPKVSLEDGLERVYKWAVENFEDLENI